MDNFLDAIDMDSILVKSFLPNQFDLVGIAKFDDAFSNHVLKNFQIHYIYLYDL